MVVKKSFKADRDYPRLDHFLTHCLPEISRSKIVKLIKEGKVKLNGEIIDRKNKEIGGGDRVELEFPEPPPAREYRPTQGLIKLFEDPYLLIIHKPAGISVHPGAGEQNETVMDIFAYHYPQVQEMKESERPGIVHRLDKDTSGVMVLAKDAKTMKLLQRQFKNREVKKTYLALVAGKMRYLNGTIDAPIIRSRRNRTRFVVARTEADIENAREASTDYSVVRAFETFSYVRLFPHTGRTHQLRVHLSYYGNPILGDKIYGKRDRAFPRLALHAYSLEFYHPTSGCLVYSNAPPPRVFRDFLKEQIRKERT